MNNIGYKKTPRNVAKLIPPNRAIPITFLASAPDPEAITSGNTPKIKENAVIKIGLNRDFDAAIAASNKLNPFLNSSFANSTIKMAFFAAIPINITKETWAKILFSKVELKNLDTHKANNAPKIANGVPSKILKGKDQLSYCADKIRKTNTNEKVKIIISDPEAFSS